MKIIVELEYSDSDFKILKCENQKEYYEKYYNEKGILYNEQCEAIYYEIEVPQLPMEGQRVGTKFGTCIVIYSYYNIDKETEHYFDKTRIIVSEE